MIAHIITLVKPIFRNRKAQTGEIKAVFKRAGYTQKEIAQVIGYHPVTLNKIIHNEKGFKLNRRKVGAVAELLGVSPETILVLFGLI